MMYFCRPDFSDPSRTARDSGPRIVREELSFKESISFYVLRFMAEFCELSRFPCDTALYLWRVLP